jgi:hypothetical protein
VSLDGWLHITGEVGIWHRSVDHIMGILGAVGTTISHLIRSPGMIGPHVRLDVVNGGLVAASPRDPDPGSVTCLVEFH